MGGKAGNGESGRHNQPPDDTWNGSLLQDLSFISRGSERLLLTLQDLEFNGLAWEKLYRPWLVSENDINNQLITASLCTVPFFQGGQMNKIHFQKIPVRQGEHTYSLYFTGEEMETEICTSWGLATFDSEPSLSARLIL